MFGSSASTGAKVGWTVLILLLPVLGFIIWLVAGPRSVKTDPVSVAPAAPPATGGEPIGVGVYTTIGSSSEAEGRPMTCDGGCHAYWAVVFLIVALVAGLFGFGGIASASAGIAQILFFVFLVLLVISLVMYFVRGRGPPL